MPNNLTKGNAMKSIPLCIVLLVVGLPIVNGAQPSRTSKQTQFDILVFAPHPDDEVLGCAGMMQRALETGKKVGVVVLTNGDGFPKAASVITKKPLAHLKAEDYRKLASTRQRQSVDGLNHIGVSKSNLMFLGYPDSMLAEIYQSEPSVRFRQKYTEKDHTYSAVGTDYHSSIHGRPAPYTKASILGDIAEIIETHKPAEIYVTHDMDSHRDHKASFYFVRDAARQTGYRGTFLTYVVHGKEHPKLPIRLVPLTAEQVEKKKLAIGEHQIPTIHDHLVGAHAKKEELFWLVSLERSDLLP